MLPWEGGVGMGGRRKRGTERERQEGPGTFDRGQVQVGTRFALNEDKYNIYQQFVV